jgi:ureidoacrylate peracid hydrolase
MQDPYLQDIVSPGAAALLVVDVQNDFCHQDGLFGKSGADMRAVQAAAKRINELLPHARKAGVPVIFVTMEHDPLTNSVAWNQRYAAPRKDACVAGTWGAELYEVKPLPGEAIVAKHRYSPFVGSNIQYVLAARQRKSLLVTGVATNICVESVLRDGFMHDYHVVLIEDCAGAYSEQAHRSTIDNTRAFLGRVIDSTALLRLWSA